MQGFKSNFSDRDIDDIARAVYEEELERKYTVPKLLAPDNAMTSEAEELHNYLHIANESWIEGLKDNVWSTKLDGVVLNLFTQRGINLDIQSPEFAFARQKVARATWAAMSTRIEHARGNHGYQSDDPLIAKAQQPAAAGGKSIKEVFDEFLEDPTKQRTVKAIQNYKFVFHVLSEMLGEHTSIQSVTRADCKEFSKLI